jgi:hypothetical protein
VSGPPSLPYQEASPVWVNKIVSLGGVVVVSVEGLGLGVGVMVVDGLGLGVGVMVVEGLGVGLGVIFTDGLGLGVGAVIMEVLGLGVGLGSGLMIGVTGSELAGDN